MGNDAMMARHYGTLSGAERFTLMIEAMARRDRVEERRLDDACPMVACRAEDEQYRGRMRRLGVLALATALDLRAPLAVLRLGASFGRHGHGVCDPVFARLMQAAFLAGRDRGRWEGGLPLLGDGADPQPLAALLVSDADLRQDLREVAACSAAGTDEVAGLLRDAAGEVHAAAVLTRWAAFGTFCQGTLGMEPLTVMRAWGLMDRDPAEEVGEAYPDARPDEARARAEGDAMARGWAKQFGGGDAG